MTSHASHERTPGRAGRPLPARAALLIAAALISGTMLPPGLAVASSVLEVSVEQAVDRAELVFEGRVLSSRTDTSNTTPRTCFQFEITDLLKGQTAEDSFELCFQGGTVNGLTLQVSDMVFPKVGERGVYFVESRSRRLVNPLYGWSQGHYLVKTGEDAQETVTTVDGRDIMAIESRFKLSDSRLSTGAAAGAKVRKATSPDKARDRPMSLSAFKTALRSMAGGIRK